MISRDGGLSVCVLLSHRSCCCSSPSDASAFFMECTKGYTYTMYEDGISLHMVKTIKGNFPI